ncbi:MAG: hypothetical protein HY647_07700 [Acidobacteria bacterium]|nr:hypothetical protein [Acidobacteriota bacterium]
MKNSPARTLRIPWIPSFFLAWILICVPFASAQEKAPHRIGNYDFAGTTSFGYRFLDLKGNQAKYNQLLNLQEGFRVFDTYLSFQSVETNQGWFDRFSLSSQNLGGDPFPVIRVQLRKHGLYDLQVGYRATQYFVNLPQTESSSNREWIDRRRFADVDLRYTPNRNLRLRFFYNKTERDGSEFSTGPFFYLPIGPDIWAAFGRANPLPFVILLREEANLFGAGFDYRVGKTDIHVEQSYRTYNNPANQQQFPNQAIQLRGSGSPSQNLVVGKWNQFASFNIPVTSIRMEQQVTDRLHFRSGYIYTHASGPTSLDASVSQGSAFTVDYAGAGSTDLTTHTAEVGFTLELPKGMDWLTDYRYQSFSQKGTQFLRATRKDLPAPVPLSEDESLRWDFGMHTVDTMLAFVPHPTFNIRGGLRFFKQDIVRNINGQTAKGTRRTKSYSPLVNFSWRPSQKFAVRGQLQTSTVVDPYVRISPEDTVGSTIRVHYSPSERWGIDNTWSFQNWETESLGLLMHSRTNSTSLWYQPVRRFGLQAGFSYGSFFAKNSIAFLRGVAPLTGFVSTTQTIDRTYFFATKANLVGNLELAFTGQFIRSTGLGTITGETSPFGPLTWPSWNTEIAYAVPKAGRLVVNWQRSYYLEDLFRLTDFGSNAFTLRWEMSF